MKGLTAFVLVVFGATVAHALERNDRAIMSGANIYGGGNPCVADTRSLCPQTMGNRPAATACLNKNIASVSSACRARLGR